MNLYGTEANLDRARNMVLREWREANFLDLNDLNDAHRERLLTTTTPGWDRYLTIQQTPWSYDDLAPDAQSRINCVLLNRAAMEVSRYEVS